MTHATRAHPPVPEQVTPRIDSTVNCPCGREWIWDEVYGWMALADAANATSRARCRQLVCAIRSPASG
jgi:hypothetical protein